MIGGKVPQLAVQTFERLELPQSLRLNRSEFAIQID
jgi:hypothetical protein